MARLDAQDNKPHRGFAQEIPTPCLAYIDGFATMLFWKNAGQPKPFAIAVTIVATSGQTHRVTAPAQPLAPDGVDQWIRRCEEYDH